tara:strand:- start:484 stop:1158 length:675 start_codon:yes stop_codon:yes gene_type:complete
MTDITKKDLTRFSESKLQNWRATYIAPALAKMHNSKKDIDAQFAEMDIGKSLAHIEWHAMGQGDHYNPYTLELDIDAEPDERFKHMKRISDDEKVETDELVPVNRMGIAKWLEKVLYSTMQENDYTPQVAMKTVWEDQYKKLINNIEELGDEQVDHRQQQINNNQGSIEMINFMQQWMESFYLAYMDKQYIPSNVKKKDKEEVSAKKAQLAKARMEEVAKKFAK